MIIRPIDRFKQLLNETALSAVSKLALTRCIDVSLGWRVVPEDYANPPRYARG
jgi:hypothetical protein